ncbi:MAG: hypothetical protein K0R38_3455 [Polyangiaceae bacterium]|jgi:hypothetical protein|nr:hypothetical protein [Polyangiaceae bacterium]
MLKLSQRLFLAATFGVTLASGACGGDDVVPLEPVTYELSVTAYNGQPGETVVRRCDGTISVAVAISPVDAFALRPANACGTSPRCGYVHFELLGVSGELLASADSATTQGVLLVPNTVPSEELGEVRVSLRSGVDGQTIVNADGEDAVLSATPVYEDARDCEDTSVGGAGAGGAGAGGAAGAGGQPSEAAAGAGGVAGAPDSGAGGAGGQPVGGAGASGQPDLAGAGGA